MSLDKKLMQKIIKFAYENKEARDYLLPVIKSNYKVAFEDIPLKKLEKWHQEKYGSLRYPSLLIQGKNVSFGTYINYYKKGDGYLKSGSEKVIKKAYDEFQKDHMRIPLRDMVRVAYENKNMRGVILKIIKKAYAEEEESINKGFIPPKTWELMIEWHRNKKRNVKYPSLKQEGQEVEFSTYQGYYNSGDTKLKNGAIQLVQKLYKEFREDLEKARTQEEVKEEEEKSELENRKDIGIEEKQQKMNEMKERNIEKRVDKVIDFMERSVKEINGEYFVDKLKNLAGNEKEVIEKAHDKLSEVIKNRMNNVQDYDEYENLQKAQEKIYELVLGKSKAFIESKERLINGIVRTVEWTVTATARNSLYQDIEFALDNFIDADPSKKDEVINKEYEENNLNRKFIDDVEVKMFEKITENRNKIIEEREKLRRIQGGEKNLGFETEIKAKIKRLKNQIAIKEAYILKDVTKEIKSKLADPNIDQDKKEEYDLILKAMDQSGHLFLKGDAFSLKFPDSDRTVVFDLKQTFLDKKEREKGELKEDLGKLFDLTQQVKSGHKSLNKDIDKIQKKLVTNLNEKQVENGAFEIEEIFDAITFGKLPNISNKISEFDEYLDEKYQQGVNRDLRESMHKTSKVLMSKIQNVFKKDAVQSTSNPGSPEQIAQDEISHGINENISSNIENKYQEIFEKLKAKVEDTPKREFLIEALKTTATGMGEKPLNDFLGETLPEVTLDKGSEVLKNILLKVTEDSPIRKGLELYLREKLKDTNSPIDVLLEKAQGQDFLDKAIDHLNENGTINDFLSFCAKGVNAITYDIPEAIDKVKDVIGFGEEGFFTELAEGNETVDFVGDMLGNAAGGVMKSVGMYAAGEWVGGKFQDEFFDLYEGQERLVQELLAGEKVPKEEEQKYHKKLQQIEDSFLTDEQWEEKYRGKTFTVTVEEPGKYWGTNKVEKEFEYKRENRGRLRKEATQKAKDVIKEGSSLYEALNSVEKYQGMVNQLKDGDIQILSRVDKTQLKKIVKTLEDKNIDKDTIKEFENLYKKTEEADQEGHGIYDQTYNREKAMKDMFELYKNYETYSKGAFFRSLYLEGKRGEEGEKIEGIGTQQWRKFKMGSEEKQEMPLLLKLRNGILTLKAKQGIDKHKLHKLRKNELKKSLYGEKPIDKTSFDISKAMNKNMLKQKLS